jgi:hypothetical protein
LAKRLQLMTAWVDYCDGRGKVVSFPVELRQSAQLSG